MARTKKSETKPTNLTYDKEGREYLKALVKSLYDYQDMRIRLDGRLTRKADGEKMEDNGTDAKITGSSYLELYDLAETTKGTEAEFLKKLSKIVEARPEWKYFLKNVKGCGPMMAAVLIAEIDIEKADTVTKIWQYAGLNAGMVQGKKPGTKRGEVIVTGEMIKGDRMTPGFLAPYNAYFRSKLIGVLATCFIKSKSSYTEFYYNYKQRLSNSDKEYKPGRKWKDEPAAHIDRAAKRYLIKCFLKDYYKEVRTMYGMSVRCPYEEEYLGRVHHA